MVRLGSGTADLRTYGRDVVPPKRGLDLVCEWKPLAVAAERTSSNRRSTHVARGTVRGRCCGFTDLIIAGCSSGLGNRLGRGHVFGVAVRLRGASLTG